MERRETRARSAIMVTQREYGQAAFGVVSFSVRTTLEQDNQSAIDASSIRRSNVLLNKTGYSHASS
jgi:hypothetical protein